MAGEFSVIQLWKLGNSCETALNLTGCRNVRIIAKGVLFRFHGLWEGLRIENCENISVEGLEFNIDRKPFSVARILEENDEGAIADIQDSRLLAGNTPFKRAMVWKDGKYTEIDVPSSIELKDDGKLLLRGLQRKGLVGCQLYLWHFYVYRPGIAIYDSSDVNIHSVRIYSFCGYGINGEGSRNISLDGVWVVPEPGLRVSTPVDATHFASCQGRITYRNCHFAGHGDDAINVHGYFHQTKIISSRECIAQYRAGLRDFAHSGRKAVFNVGEHLILTRKDNLEILGEYTLVKSQDMPENAQLLELDGPLPVSDSELLLNAKERCSVELEISGCTFSDHNARSILAKCRRVKIMNNIFRHSVMAAIYIAPESFYAEASVTEEILIKGNIFLDCGTRLPALPYDTACILVQVDAPSLPRQRHGRLCIEYNLFEHTGTKHAVMVRDVENLKLSCNRFSPGQESILLDSRRIGMIDCDCAYIDKTINN